MNRDTPPPAADGPQPTLGQMYAQVWGTQELLTALEMYANGLADMLGLLKQALNEGPAVPAEQAAAVTPVADFRVREHRRKELERIARRIARQYFDDNFTGVRAQINKETGAYAEYGNNDQLKEGIAYAKQWLAELAAERAR